MANLQRRVISFLFLPLLLAAARRPAPIDFDNIGARNGLSQVYLRCVFQDRTGFIWIGTQDGLNRYDGQSFQIFRNIPGDPFSLPNNSIADILEDRRGVLWIATTGGGVVSLDRTTGKFHRYDGLTDPTAKTLLEDRRGMIWVGTQFGGLHRFDSSSGSFQRVQPGLVSRDNTDLLEDRSGIIWIATRDLGLERYDPITQQLTHFRHNPKDPASLPHNRIWSLYLDRAGSLWVATAHGAAVVRDPANPRFEKISLNRSAEPEVFSVLQDASADHWLGTSEGLYRILPGQPPVQYRPDATDGRSLSGRQVFSILEDRSGTLWFGTSRGLSRLGVTNRRFATFRRGLGDWGIRAIYEDEHGTAWVGTDKGLNSIDSETEEIRPYRHIPSGPMSLPEENISWISAGPAPGRLWIGNQSGLCDFDTRTARCRSLDPQPARVIEPSHDGRYLWIGSDKGLRHLDVLTRTSTFYRHDPANPDSLADNEIRAIAIDSKGAVWAGTRNHGLERLDPATGKFTHFPHYPDDPKSLVGSAVYCLLADSRNRLWVGTTAGISILPVAGGPITHFTTRDGLPNDTVNAILEDASGSIWISTNLGLARLRPETREIRVYNVSHGLQDNEFNGNAAFYSPATHHMYFGGISGFNRFVPELVKDSSFDPAIVFTAFQASGRELPQAVTQGHIELSWRDSMFAIEFASLDHSAPELNRYSFRLDNFDQGWRTPSSVRTAVYTNLDSGSYVFRVKGTNSDGVWASREAIMRIDIVPPPWKRWWFIGSFVALAVAVVFYFYRTRMAGFRASQAAQERFARLLIESQEAERKRIAAELHDSIGQNLIVIRNHALLALAKSGNQHLVQSKLEDISQSASEALDETRELASNLRPQQLERLGLTKALLSMMTRTAAASSIAFETHIDNVDSLLSKEGEINLYRIVQESTNNILKHSDASEASVDIRCKDGCLSVAIRDNGKGWDSATPAPIGFGLTGIAERARILSARHHVESAPGRGTMILLEVDI